MKARNSKMERKSPGTVNPDMIAPLSHFPTLCRRFNFRFMAFFGELMGTTRSAEADRIQCRMIEENFPLRKILWYQLELILGRTPRTQVGWNL